MLVFTYPVFLLRYLGFVKFQLRCNHSSCHLEGVGIGSLASVACDRSITPTSHDVVSLGKNEGNLKANHFALNLKQMAAHKKKENDGDAGTSKKSALWIPIWPGFDICYIKENIL